MIDLREEIEVKLKYAKNLYDNINENDNGYLKSYFLGTIQSYETILKCLENHNIITAPKTIKLSEIISKLNEKLILETDYKASVIRYGKDIFIVVKKPFRTFDGVIAEINSTNKIVKIDEKYVIESCKWLYALWITGTIIEDD